MLLILQPHRQLVRLSQIRTFLTTNGKYEVLAHTSNGPLHRSILDALVYYTLVLKARTFNVSAPVSPSKGHSTPSPCTDTDDQIGQEWWGLRDRITSVWPHILRDGSKYRNTWWEKGHDVVQHVTAQVRKEQRVAVVIVAGESDNGTL